jgi:diguanylate cyclase (GGDEF)-like protein
MAMPLSRLSMRVSLVVTVLAIGLLGLMVALFAAGLHRQQLREDRRAALAEQLRQGAQSFRRELENEGQVLAELLRVDPSWRSAMPAGNRDALLHGIGKHSLAMNPSRLLRLRLLNENSQPVAMSLFSARAIHPGCDALRTSLARAMRPEVPHPASGVCVAGGYPVHVVLVPLDGAFLEAVSDLVPAVQGLEQVLQYPLRLSLANGQLVYQSPAWKAAAERPGAVRAAQPIGEPAAGLVVEASRDASAADAMFERHLLATILIAAICLVALSYIGLLVLDKTAIAPLQALTARLRGIREDKGALGQTVKVGGNAEVVELEEGFNDMTARLKELYENLERMAFTDPLTSLPNRALFHDRLQQLILSARREQKTFALCIMDLDHFKDINDTLGHPVGDALLKQVAERLRMRLRESDTVARLGGDEFAVILPTVGRQHAALAARMLLQALRVPFAIDDQNLDIGASIGIVLYPDHGMDADVLIQRADVAMYAAKQEGGGYAFYEADHDQHSSQRLALMGELRRAVDQEQFELHYQPKIDLGTGRVMGVEALMRWRHPRDGLIMPDNFIPLLEQTGQIRALTPWMLNEVMGFSRRLQAEGLSLTVSMNLSVRDLQGSHLGDMLDEQLQASQADPSMLEFEITESAVMTEPVRTVEALNRIADAGFRLAIDDFGTGYSSFAYLKKLPVHTLKIDKSFVAGMAHDDHDTAIVRTSIELAHSLNLKIVAEGVEDAAVLERLRELGCDAVQGHYISRPLPAADLLAWLRQSSWGLGDDDAVSHSSAA